MQGLTEVNYDDFFRQLYEGISLEDVKRISNDERKQFGYSSSTLSYGEIEINEMRKIFDHLELNGFLCDHNSKFVDIGSGIGKPLFAAALLYNFSCCKGIEILSTLNEISTNKILRNWTKMLTKLRARKKLQVDIELVCGDALYLDWSDGTVIFIHATAFDPPMMEILTRALNKLVPYSFVIVLSRTISSPLLDHIESIDLITSWGETQAHIYRRSNEEYVPAGAKTTDTEFLMSFGIVK